MGLDMYLYNGDEQVGYWRKANQIHNWFVENVQGGVDDCGSYPVSRKQTEELLGIVESILDGKEDPQDILPTASGFFFGSTEYGDWYMEDLKDAKKILTNILESGIMKDNWDLHYYASW